MPKLIDTHPMVPFKADELKALQDAPGAEAVRKHHAKVGISCDFVHEVESTRS